jgi:hypothetical protein
MYTVSKSMFSNKTIITGSRSARNPVGTDVIIPPIVITINKSILDTMQEVETYYGSNLKNKTYTNIPSDYDKYVDLFAILNYAKSIATDPKLILILTIVEDALVGAINAFTLYSQNASLQIDNTNLQNTVNTILSNKNNASVSLQPANAGQMSITKTFTLAPIFNYYIIIFGMPAYGVGFDPVKVYFLEQILKNMGVNPYQ